MRSLLSLKLHSLLNLVVEKEKKVQEKTGNKHLIKNIVLNLIGSRMT